MVLQQFCVDAWISLKDTRIRRFHRLPKGFVRKDRYFLDEGDFTRTFDESQFVER